MAGLTSYARALALQAVIPNGTTLYVALFTTLPIYDGTGGVEASGSSYARKSHASWLTAQFGALTRTYNNGAITFTALTGALSGIVGWGIYDASSGGNLIAFGEIRDAADAAVTKNFIATDEPRFIDQSLYVRMS
jgi:hypothetical protein